MKKMSVYLISFAILICLGCSSEIKEKVMNDTDSSKVVCGYEPKVVVLQGTVAKEDARHPIYGSKFKAYILVLTNPIDVIADSKSDSDKAYSSYLSVQKIEMYYRAEGNLDKYVGKSVVTKGALSSENTWRYTQVQMQVQKIIIK